MPRSEQLRLAFSGRSGSGKDSVACAVYSMLGVTPRRLTFGEHVVAEARALAEEVSAHAADPGAAAEAVRQRLKVDADTAAAAVERVIAAQKSLAGSIPRYGLPRQLLQWWGADVRRREEPLHWIRCMVAQLEEIPESVPVYVTDCRYPDELSLLREHGFHTVHVVVDDGIRRRRLLERDGGRDVASDKHSTETSITPALPHDITVDNSGDLEDAARHVLDQARVISSR
ncbi:deoxynucleotide monophosphate kinase family protein [Streptomyces sp. MUM 178J]|uniref:deoxynucleotide monophosphate kinase family protein n=1 Tax=Streptomyces sp. MUM 178J TaxID=2791991 RepID=UPI001F03D97A|nr:hypothetical protein [Streptomyces sp. MUM 178J]WRQ80750.1 hypothetical protein I3F59_016060 [Streptomyces sp. MUM 178J]